MSHPSLPQSYDGPDDIVIGDGTGLKITHTSSFSLSPSLHLSNVLCAPSLKKNLIYVSKFCRSNHTTIEFFPYYFIVNNLNTRAPPLLGKNRHDLYEWPCLALASDSSIVFLSTNVTSKVSPTVWHGRLGRVALKIL